MKLQELFEDVSINFIKHVKELGYSKLKSYKKTGGKSYPVNIFRKDFDIEDMTLTFEYVINPETESWTFNVSSEEVPAVEISSGENIETLNKHVKKKHKISKSQIEKYFK